jgi:hypothetical protein
MASGILLKETIQAPCAKLVALNIKTEAKNQQKENTVL